MEHIVHGTVAFGTTSLKNLERVFYGWICTVERSRFKANFAVDTTAFCQDDVDQRSRFQNCFSWLESPHCVVRKDDTNSRFSSRTFLEM